jgi:hypothetical protein
MAPLQDWTNLQVALICTLRPSTTCSSKILAIDFSLGETSTNMETIKSKLQSLRIADDPAVNALKYTWPALKLALIVLEKTLDGVPIPGLKGAIGGFLELAETAEASETN